MSRLILDLDTEKCCACGACAIACMDQNDINVLEETPLRSVFTLENIQKRTVRYLSFTCMHCVEAPCMMACPESCFSKDEMTGFIVYDNENCIGCHSCASACPFGAISYTAEGKMIKCDGCVTRIQHGLEPACVRVCSFNALSLQDEKEQKKRKLAASLNKIVDMIS